MNFSFRPLFEINLESVFFPRLFNSFDIWCGIKTFKKPFGGTTVKQEKNAIGWHPKVIRSQWNPSHYFSSMIFYDVECYTWLWSDELKGNPETPFTIAIEIKSNMPKIQYCIHTSVPMTSTYPSHVVQVIFHTIKTSTCPLLSLLSDCGYLGQKCQKMLNQNKIDIFIKQ